MRINNLKFQNFKNLQYNSREKSKCSPSFNGIFTVTDIRKEGDTYIWDEVYEPFKDEPLCIVEPHRNKISDKVKINGKSYSLKHNAQLKPSLDMTLSEYIHIYPEIIKTMCDIPQIGDTRIDYQAYTIIGKKNCGKPKGITYV